MIISKTFGLIESFDERQEQAKVHCIEAKLEASVEFLLGDAATCLAQLKEQNIAFDMAFIDASKMQYMSYYQILTPMLNAGGLFIADNTMSHRDEMLDFILALKNDPQYLTCDIDTANGLIIAQKIN